ncbi:MAG TPA: anti-sigma factor [Chthoniobacterales bacterium]|nr:anti-sigma factor [Chthoniobacterales bacterium]
MNHDEIRELLHPYSDGELDLLTAREVEHHLRSCDDCRALEAQIGVLRSALTNDAPAYRAPAQLRRNVRAALRREAKADERGFSPWLIFATGAVCAIAVAGLILLQTIRTSRGNAIVDEVVSNHVRSLLATHLVDVASSDQHTVKPWFDGKVDFAPEVRDLSAAGFPLVGGRLDYLGGKTVAALVYYRNKHPINVFIMPAIKSRDTAVSASTLRGYHILAWTHDEMYYWAVSDLNQTELRQLIDLLEQ